MKRIKIVAAAFVLFTLSYLPYFNAQAQVQDFLKVPGPLTFNQASYKLAWSAHPNEVYYKQEYLKPGEEPDSFKEMFLVEFISGKISAKDILSLKVKELEERKKTDQLVNYDVINSPDGSEYIIDFLISSGTGENLEIVEWNAYRYKEIKEKSGKKGVILLAISRRAYGEEITDFLKNLSAPRLAYRNELIGFKIPELEISKAK